MTSLPSLNSLIQLRFNKPYEEKKLSLLPVLNVSGQARLSSNVYLRPCFSSVANGINIIINGEAEITLLRSASYAGSPADT